MPAIVSLLITKYGSYNSFFIEYRRVSFLYCHRVLLCGFKLKEIDEKDLLLVMEYPVIPKSLEIGGREF